jgi:cytochrome c556
MRARSAFGSIVLALSLGGGLALPAAADVFEQRSALMKEIGDQMRGLAPMFRGESPYDAADVRARAEAIAERAGERIATLFPEGTLRDDSRALPTIWEEWERFEALSGLLEERARTLAAAADGDDARRAFGEFANTCRNCHTDFRRPED